MTQFTVPPLGYKEEEDPLAWMKRQEQDTLGKVESGALSLGNPPTMPPYGQVKDQAAWAKLTATMPPERLQRFQSLVDKGGTIQGKPLMGKSLQRERVDLQRQELSMVRQAQAFEQERFDETTTYQRGQAASAIQREQQKEAGITPVTLDWKFLGVDDPAIFEPGTSAFFQYRKDIIEALRGLFPVYDAPDATINRISRGEKVEVGVRSLGAGELGLAEESEGKKWSLAGREFNLREETATLDMAIARADQSGLFYDPDDETKTPVTTLKSKLYQLQQAELTGTLYDGTPTLQAQMQTWTMEHQDKAVFGFDRVVTRLNENGLAVKETEHVYGTNEIALASQQNDRTWQQLQLTGFLWVNPETGQEEFFKGADDRAMDRAHGTWALEEMTRNGYSEAVLDPEGNQRKDPQGNLLFRKVEGTQGPQVRLQERQLDLQEQGMEADDAYRYAAMEQQRQQYEGYFQVRGVNLENLRLTGSEVETLATYGPNIPWDQFRTDKGIDAKAYQAWAQNPTNKRYTQALAASLIEDGSSEVVRRLQGVLGRAPTVDEVQRLLAGETVAALDKNGNPVVDFIGGSATLEKDRLDLQEDLTRDGWTDQDAKAAAERIYQDKVSNGYWGTGPTGKPAWIRGKQEDDAYLLTLQNTFQVDREEAQRIWTEQQRTGYYQIQEVKVGDKTYNNKVWIEGTQPFEARMQQRQLDLQRDGWVETAARQQAQWGNDQFTIWGGYRTVVNPETQVAETTWVPGSQDHQKSMQQMVSDLTEAGWAANAAQDQAQFIRQQSTTDRTYLGQEFVSARKWHYLNQAEKNEDGTSSLSDAQALLLATADWDQVKDKFGVPLQEKLEGMRLQAAKDQYDASMNMQLLSATITSMASLGGGLVKLFMDGNGVESLWTAGGVTVGYLKSVIPGLSDEDAQSIVERVTGALTNDAPESIIAEGTIGEVSASDFFSYWTDDEKATAAGFGSSWKAGFASMIPSAATAGKVLGAATAVGAAALVVGGIYKGVTSLMSWWQRRRDKEKAEDADYDTVFDEWYTVLSWDDQQQVLAILKESDISWKNRDAAVRGMEDGRTYLLRGESVPDVVSQSALTNHLATLQPSTEMGHIAAKIRPLKDAGLFVDELTVDDMTLGDWDKIFTAWKALPGTARKADIKGASHLDHITAGNIESMRTDIATFGVDMEIWGTEEVLGQLKGAYDILRRGFSDTSVLTGAERSVIYKLYDQLNAEFTDFADVFEGEDITAETLPDKIQRLVWIYSGVEDGTLDINKIKKSTPIVLADAVIKIKLRVDINQVLHDTIGDAQATSRGLEEAIVSGATSYRGHPLTYDGSGGVYWRGQYMGTWRS
uniref:Uncharacterized protein n=1 Tax=viral metagenome TaxID=1070528 RepID=A0A6H1ZAC4_9ZZZZ